MEPPRRAEAEAALRTIDRPAGPVARRSRDIVGRNAGLSFNSRDSALGGRLRRRTTSARSSPGSGPLEKEAQGDPGAAQCPAFVFRRRRGSAVIPRPRPFRLSRRVGGAASPSPYVAISGSAACSWVGAIGQEDFAERVKGRDQCPTIADFAGLRLDPQALAKRPDIATFHDTGSFPSTSARANCDGLAASQRRRLLGPARQPDQDRAHERLGTARSKDPHGHGDSPGA